MSELNIKITANISSSLSYLTRQCEIYLSNKYHNFTDANSFSFLRSIRILNNTNNDILDCKLRISFNTPEIKDSEVFISCLDKGKIIEITNNLNIKINPEKLYVLNESKIINANFILYDNLGSVIATRTYPLKLLPIGQLSSGISGDVFVPEMLTCYVTPNDDYVNDVARKAAKILQSVERSTFVGYQKNDPDFVIKQLGALYKALRNEGIAYAMPPASFEKVFQRVRLPQEVLKLKQGTCIDTTLLFASLIENIGLHPLIFLMNKHAFVGCWLEETSQSGTNEDDSSIFSEASEKGISKLVLIETTLICSGQNASLNNAIEVGRNNLTKYLFETAIDVNSCRKSEIYKPIPTIKKDGNIEIHFDVLDILNEDLAKVDTSLRDKYIKNAKATDKFDLWERKLLDLSLSNKLINYKTRKNSLNVLLTNPQELLEEITNKDKFNIEGYSSKEKGIDTDILSYQDKNYIENALKSGRLVVETDVARYEDEIKKIARRSNSAFEESGSNILFLAIGLIEWYPTLSSVYPNYAPLLLIPAQLSSRKVGRFFNIDFFLDEARLNITFLEYVKQNYNLNVKLNGRDLSLDQNGIIGFDEICNTLSSELNIKNWKIIKDKAFIDTFSFSHFVMWEDIYNRKKTLLNNAVVSSLYTGTSEKVKKDDTEIDIDKEVTPIDIAAPLSADSSQIEAIVSCAKGDSFVLFGPPGTGKSQTIANMIVNLMYQGKSVLFVAEKMVALEVVKKRLDEIGLGNFCCQIHSNKISKSEVLRQIDNAIEMQNIEEPSEILKKSNELLAKRNLLNERLKELHSDKKYFMSLYDSILMYEDLKIKGFDKIIKINNEYLNVLTKDEFNKNIELLKDVELAAKESGDYKNNPFNFYHGTTYNLSIRNDVLEKLKLITKEIDNVMKFENSFAKKYEFLEIDDLKKMHVFLNLIDLLKKKDTLNFDSLIDFDYEENSELSNAYLDNKISELSYKEQITRRFSKNIFGIEEKEFLKKLDEISRSKNLFKRLIVKKEIIKQLQVYSLANEQKIKRKELDNILITIKKYKELKEYNAKIAKNIYYHFDKFEHETSSDYLDIKNLFNNTLGFYKEIKKSGFYTQNNIKSFKKLYENKEKLFSKEIDEFENKNRELYAYLENLKNESKIDFISQNTTFEEMYQKANDAIKDIEKFNLWILFNKSLAEAENNNLGFVVNDIKEGNIKVDEIVLTYMFSIYYKLIMSYFEVYDLNDFTKPTIEKHIKEYEEFVSQYSKLTIENVAAKVTQNSPVINSKYITSTEPAMIKKLIKSNGKGTTLRQIMNKLGDFIKKICPCFLMSPLSIAQYIDPDKMHFDVVIFDEASQIPTSEAIGAIARGNSVVIAGDYNQMPPTNFFKTQIDNDVSFFENETDLDSLLDDCISVGLPQRKLLWHYRSHHESLIAFSNNKFYQNNLFTFPSPSNLISNVKFINVHGTYERNRGVNVVEANAIVKEIVRRLKDKELSKKSIGVVTFNLKQQNLIQDLLDVEYDKDPNLNFKPGNETIFVKNLENVQGDERDVILFSICFARRKDGGLSLNFGPLSLEKGERRLNVAVSRSRDEMIIYSSIEPMDINPNNAKNDGARYLRDLLEYAKYGTKTLTKKSDSKEKKFDRSVAAFIAKDLEKLGYKCDLDIGASNFRVDIAIKNKNEDAYCLGIILDSSFYYDAKTCRDRNVLHYNILSKLGWNILRIWTIDYYDHPNEVIKSIESSIKKSASNEQITKIETKDKKLKDEVTFKKKDEDSWMINKISYTKYYSIISKLGDDREVLIALKGLIKKEAPLSFNYIKDRIRTMAKASKISKKEAERIRFLLGECGFYHTLSPDTYWLNEEQYFNYKTYRENKDFEITNIPYEELGNLFSDIINDLKMVDKKDLFKFVTVFYGYKVMSQKTLNYLEDALTYLVKNKYNKIIQSGNIIKIIK